MSVTRNVHSKLLFQMSQLEGKYSATHVRTLNNYQLYRIKKGDKDVSLFIPRKNFYYLAGVHVGATHLNVPETIDIIIRPWRENDKFDPRERIAKLEKTVQNLQEELAFLKENS